MDKQATSFVVLDSIYHHTFPNIRKSFDTPQSQRHSRHDTNNKPSVLSISWGDAEDNASWTDQAIQQVNEALQVTALAGITVCVASGDDGSDDQVGDGHAHVDFPAFSPCEPDNSADAA